MQPIKYFSYRRFIALLALLIGLLGWSVAQAQVQPVFRIGVIDDTDGSLTQGAQLAVQQINAQGGVIGADGTIFQLQLVIQSADNVDFAIANLNQASVIAVIGPALSETVLNNRATLANLNVPFLIGGTDDTLLRSDTTGRLLRLTAPDSVRGQALANFLVTEQSVASLATVQLDIESTASRVTFLGAAAQQGLIPTNEYILSDDFTLERIVADISTRLPQFVVAYGAPDLAADLYTQLRQSDYPGGFVYPQAGSQDFRDLVPEGLLQGVFGVAGWSYTYGNPVSQAFVLDYLAAFGDVPAVASASAYDGVYLLREAISRPGALNNNLRAISNFEGVQGIINPAGIGSGESNQNVAINRLGQFGAPSAVARYSAGTILEVTDGSDTVSQPIATATPRPTNTPIPTPTPDGVNLTITRAVQNVRTGPGLNYDILGQLPQGSTARVIGANIDFSWVAISFRGTTGWLSRGILDLTGNTNTVPVLQAPPTPTPLPATATPTAQPIPDIVIVSATLNRITIGQAFNVNVVVRNQGGGAAGQFAVAASYEPGGQFTAVNLQGLNAGSEVSITLSGTLSGPTGPQNVTIVADLNNQVNEGAGEANNSAYLHRYIADAPLFNGGQAVGSATLQDLQTISLDGGSNDLQYGGGGLAPLGATRLVVLNGFTSFNDVHRDAIANAALANVPIANVQAGQLIGIQTDGGAIHGVLQIVSVNPGVSINFNYRIYNS